MSYAADGVCEVCLTVEMTSCENVQTDARKARGSRWALRHWTRHCAAAVTCTAAQMTAVCGRGRMCGPRGHHRAEPGAAAAAGSSTRDRVRR